MASKSEGKMKDKQELSTKNTILACALASLVVLIAAIIIGRSLTSQAILNNKVINKKQQAEKQLEKNLAVLPDLRSNYLSLGARADLVLRYMPTSPDLATFTSTLESIAGVSAVKLASVSGENDLYSVQLEGNSDTVLRALQNIEVSGKPFVVKSVQLEGSTQRLSALVTLNAFHMPLYKLEDKKEAVK